MLRVLTSDGGTFSYVACVHERSSLMLKIVCVRGRCATCPGEVCIPGFHSPARNSTHLLMISHTGS